MNRVDSSKNIVPSPRGKGLPASLQSYVPAIVIRQHSRQGSFKGPCYEKFEAALFYADVCGFSSIAERLSQLKDLDGGSDRLTDLMSGYLGAIIDIIRHHGGDIIEFAGDSFLAMWQTDSQNTLQQSTLRAIQCGLIVQQTVGNYKLDVPGTHTIELHLRVQVGAGPVVGSHVGLHNEEGGQIHGRLVYILSGIEVDNTILADHFNSSGKVVVTKAAWKLVGDVCVGHEVENSPVFQVDELKVGVPTKDLLVPSPSSNLNGRISEYIPHQILEQIEAQEGAWIAEVRNVTTMFIKFQPENIQPTDPTYVTHLQQNCCEVIEVVSNFDGLLAHYSVDDKGLYAVVVFGIPSHEDDATRAVYTAVQLVKNFHNRNRTLCIGISTGVAVTGSVGNANRSHYTLFGSVVNLAARLMQMSYTNSSLPLPPLNFPLASSKPPSPATNGQHTPISSPRYGETTLPLTPTKRPLTISLQQQLVSVSSKENMNQNLPDSPHATTFLTVDGQPITGTFDTILTPKEFDPKKNTSWIDSYTANTILCDEETYHLARSRFYFVPLDPVQLKGFTKLVKIFTPEIMMNWKQYKTSFDMGMVDDKMVGREREKSEFLQSIEKMLAAEGGSALLIEGEPGQGKTSLITTCANVAIQKGFSVFMGAADAIETGTPYYALRSILQQLADIKQCDANEVAREKLIKIVPQKSQPYMSYFNPICGLDFPETDASVLMKGNTRSQFLQNMVLGLFQQEARARPTLLVIDDVHWLDSASWNITIGAIFQVHPLLVVLGTRPVPSPIPPNYQKLIDLKVKQLLLTPLTSNEIEQLVVKTLGLHSAPPSKLIEYLYDSASGNAFFTRELMLVLKDNGVLKTEDGIASFHLSEDAQQQDSIPRSLNKVISCRVDRLGRTSKMILRVASVIGRTFLWSTLKSVLPSTEVNGSLEDKLSRLEEAGLITAPELVNRELCITGQAPFSFKHVTVQQTVYNSLTHKQKRDLHIKVAQWYLTSNTNTDTISPILFHHYHSAERFPEALKYCIKAAEQSMQATAVKEAIRFLELALENPASNTLSDSEMAKIWVMMGDANGTMGKNRDASNCFIKAMVYYGQPDPIESTKNETGYSVVVNLLAAIKATQPCEPGTPESNKAFEIANLAYRWSHSLALSMFEVPLYCYATMTAMLFVQKSGWAKYMSGVWGAATNCVKYFAPNHADNLDAQVRAVLKTHLELTHTLPTPIRTFNLRSGLSTLYYLGGVADLQTMEHAVRRIQGYCETTAEMYILIVATSVLSAGLFHKGDLEKAFEEVAAAFKLCRLVGDHYYFGIGAKIVFCVGYSWMGRFQQANEWRIQLSDSLRVGGDKIEQRLHVGAAGCFAYYFICKGEWDTAWEHLQPVVTGFIDKISNKAIIFTFILVYTTCLLSLIAISKQTHLPYHKVALEAANLILDDFYVFAKCFSCAQPRALIFTAQLRGESMEPTERQRLCREALTKAQEIAYYMDEGWAAFELAKCFEANTPYFNKYCQQAMSTFEKCGAMHFYTEVSKYIKQVT